MHHSLNTDEMWSNSFACVRRGSLFYPHYLQQVPPLFTDILEGEYALTMRLHSVYQVSHWAKVKAFNNDQDKRILIYQVSFCFNSLQHSCSKVAQLIHAAQEQRSSESSKISREKKKYRTHTRTYTHIAFGAERDPRFSKCLNKIFKQRGKKTKKQVFPLKNINQWN